MLRTTGKENRRNPLGLVATFAKSSGHIPRVDPRNGMLHRLSRRSQRWMAGMWDEAKCRCNEANSRDYVIRASGGPDFLAWHNSAARKPTHHDRRHYLLNCPPGLSHEP